MIKYTHSSKGKSLWMYFSSITFPVRFFFFQSFIADVEFMNM